MKLSKLAPSVVAGVVVVALATLALLRSANGAADVASQPVEPERHHIRIDELPPPDPGASVTNPPRTVRAPARASLRVPPGFRVQIFADQVEGARWLVLTPGGDVLVTQKQGNEITLLRDADGDGAADERRRFGGEENGLHLPFGIAFHDDAVFIGNTDAVRRYPYRSGQDALQGRGTQIHTLPGGGYRQHWTRNVVLAPGGGRLFVTVGSESNADIEPLPRAAVLTMNLDGSDSRVFASGLRNPIGLAFHPETREPYVVVNERDRLGDRLVPDFLTRVEQGGFYGWPFAYLRPDLLDPRHAAGGRSVRPELVGKTLTPDVLIEAHGAAIGLTFYRGTTFPERYRRGAYVALHGSWNRSRAAGYKVIFVPFDARHRPEGHYEDFVTGFVLDERGPRVWGRPTGILELPDGSLLFSDDENDRVYRVSYEGTGTAEGSPRAR